MSEKLTEANSTKCEAQVRGFPCTFRGVLHPSSVVGLVYTADT